MPQSLEPKPTPWWVMLLAALAIGVIAGLGAIAFRGMIAGFHNLLFLGQLSWHYDANVHTPASPWGAWVIGVPVLGAVGVAFLVKTFAPEAKGHGVPEVMDAIYYQDGKIRPIVAAIKSLASALSIGSGGSVGREGPIIQIGAAFGSTVGQVISMPGRQRAILIAAGAAGGIAATFNTPVGGIVFAVELMLPVVAPFSLLCVALSTIAATYIGRFFLGVVPSFNVPAMALVTGSGPPLSVFPWFAALGLIVGLMAWLMTRSIYWFEDLFDRMPGNYYTRHTCGMLIVGLILYGFMFVVAPWFGQPQHYYVEGVGYATIMDVLGGEQSAVGFLLLLAFAKLLVTSLTLGSGASGGVFSPSMFIGATLGGCMGSAVAHFLPDLGVGPPAFAYAGMAAMVGGTTGAVITATIMVFEMTRDYTAILPVILTVVLAGAVRQWLSPPTIYTLKLLRRGHVVPQGLQAWRGELRSRDVMSAQFLLMSESRCRDKVAVHSALRRAQVVVVTDSAGDVLGVIDARSHLDEERSVSRAWIVVRPDDYFHDVLRRLPEANARIAVVTDRSSAGGPLTVLGIISANEVFQVSCAGAELIG